MHVIGLCAGADSFGKEWYLKDTGTRYGVEMSPPEGGTAVKAGGGIMSGQTLGAIYKSDGQETHWAIYNADWRTNKVRRQRTRRLTTSSQWFYLQKSIGRRGRLGDQDLNASQNLPSRPYRNMRWRVH